MLILILEIAYFVSLPSLLLILFQLLLHLTLSRICPSALCQPMDSPHCVSRCKMETEEGTNTNSNLWCLDHNESVAHKEKFENMSKKITIE